MFKDDFDDFSMSSSLVVVLKNLLHLIISSSK